jgi:3-deoxy-7-phosphoheptulonate synthase/chorismate mutase
MASNPTSRAAAASVPELRERMDRLNQRLLGLIEQRARLAIRIGRAKQSLGMPAADPQREQAMIEHVLASAGETLDPADLERVFRAIFKASRNAVVHDRRRTARSRTGRPRARSAR